LYLTVLQQAKQIPCRSADQPCCFGSHYWQTLMVDIVFVLTYRHMEIDDVEQVQAIDRLSFSIPWPETSYHFELLKNPGSILWVAEYHSEGGKRQIVGMIVIWMILDEAHIATIAVHPEYRSQGIGRKLLALALREAIEHGAVESMLEVRANNLVAQALYKDFGYEIVGRRPRYYQDNQEDAVLMSVKNIDQDYLEWLTDGEWKTGSRHGIN
jgi:ribosomal-protein-alanine N-acetyltransferase